MGDGMAQTHVRPETLEEHLIYWSIVGTWGIWVMGGLYILAPALGWTLAAIATARRLGLTKAPHAIDRASLPIGSAIWLLFMAFMAVGLLIGHSDYDLGSAQTIKSFVGWMKGWALMAVFIYVGATMRIRPSIVYRATGILGAQTVALAPIFVLAAFAHLPRPLYVSPLQAVGGPGPEFFTVELYGIEPETGGPRWRFFAPWAPAAAFVANIGFVFALYEKSRLWKAIGIVATLVVCILSQSRLALIAIPVVSLLTVVLSGLSRSLIYSIGAAASAALLPFVDTLISLVDDAITRFKNARASSSRVRATLQSIAIHRWWNEAPIWGHGIVEKGPHLVEYMPIGSHHTWNGLLYVKGIVGFLALAIPLAWSFFEMVAKSQSDRVARAALGVLIVLILYSFGENLEILVYLFWPGVVIIGIATRRRYITPYHGYLGRYRPS